jgi:hypothetical protein
MSGADGKSGPGSPRVLFFTLHICFNICRTETGRAVAEMLATAPGLFTSLIHHRQFDLPVASRTRETCSQPGGLVLTETSVTAVPPRFDLPPLEPDNNCEWPSLLFVL